MEYGILFLLVLVFLFYIQTLLSRTENKHFGMIVPAVTFIATVVMLFVIADEFNIIKSFFTLVFTNIPTYILLWIYHRQRKKLEKNRSKKSE